jgi:NO-binding membrane sensor protein with MHYT domain
MGSTTELGFGWATPILSYLMACVGAGLGLRCMVRALASSGRRRLNWLLTASTAIGTGIWTMHFIAMLGFSVSGTAIRYDGPLTVASLAVSIGVVGLGVFIVGYGRSRGRALALGGLVMGVGVAAMHYLGMSAMHVAGTVVYDNRTVALSVVVAVVAATAALWAALTVSSPAAAAGASLIMGVAVTAMHYIGMTAARIQVDAAGATPPGASGTDFIVPMTVMLGSYLFLTSAFVALSSTAQERSATEAAELLRSRTLMRGASPASAATRLSGPAGVGAEPVRHR